MLSTLSATPRLRRLGFAALLASLWFPAAAGAGEVRIGGTGNALGTMRQLGDAFVQSHPGTKVTVLNSIGSSGAIKAVPKGAIDIGVSSRLLTEEETGSGLSTAEYARAPTVFAVQEKGRSTSITLAQVADIYSGKLTRWPDGTPIRPIMRQPGDDNTRQIKRLSPAIERAVTAAEQRAGLAFAVTDQDAADQLESIPGSIGVTTLALIRSEKRALRALALGGVEPTPDNAHSGRYPMSKHFYFVLPRQATPDAQAFIKFVNSASGRKILEQTGHSIP